MTLNETRAPGDLSAAELFRNHALFVARFLYRLGVPAEAIDDTVQDVFLVVHQRGGYRPGPAKPTTYLAVIASRVASSERRQQRRRAARVGNTPLDEIHAEDDDPALRVERCDDLRRLQDALSRLDPALRDTLLLADFEEETAPAIAQAMGVPVGTVYWRLHEARKKFRRALSLADGNRARVAGQRPEAGRVGERGLSRGAKLVTLIGGWLGGSANSAQARELVDAWHGATPDFDLAGGLARHLERVAAAPPEAVLPNAVARLPLGASSGKLAIGAGTAAVAAGAIVTLAAIGPSWRTPAAAPSDDEPAPVRLARAEAVRSEGASSTASASTASASSPAAADVIPAVTHERDVQNAAAEPGRAPALGLERTRARNAEKDVAQGDAEDESERMPPNPLRAASAAPRARAAMREARSASERAPRAESVPRAAREPSSASHHDPLLEARALKRADGLLATDPATALAIVEDVSRTIPEEYLAEERHYIQVMALYGLGRRDAAERAAHRFLSRYPSSAFRERVQAARTTAKGP